MEGTLADVGLSRERGTRRHTPQGGPPTPPGLPVSPKWSVPAPPTSPLLWPSLSRTRYCLRELKKQVRSQGGEGWGKRSPRAKPWGARPRPPAPTPGAGWLPAGHAHGAAGRREAGERACSFSLPGAGAGRSGRALRGAGPPGAGAGRGSGKRAPSAAAGGARCARTRRLTREPGAQRPGDASGGKPPRCCTRRALAAVTSARRERGGGEFRGILGPGVRGAAARERGAQTGRGGGQ